MRSLTVDRKTRGAPRGKAVRPAVRGKRDQPKVQPGSARTVRAPGGTLQHLKVRASRFVRRPMLTLCGVVLMLVLLGALFASGVVGRGSRAVHSGLSVIVADAGFGISEIHITGNRRTPTRSIEAALGMQPGQSIFSADLWNAQARLSHLDWIASAEVHRRYPDAIFVSLVEKRPFALWQMPPGPKGAGTETGPIAVVERGGAVITTRDVENFRHLPKLVGAGAPAAAADLVDAVQTHRAVAARVAAYARVSMRRWNLILDDGVVVKLPEAGWARELTALEHLIIDAGILERDVSEIDLRSATQYFFLLKNGEKKDVERGKET